MSSSATKVLPANPFSQFKSTVNLDPKTNVVSNMPDEVATLIFSKMRIEQVQFIIEGTETLMERYSLYRNMVSEQTSLTGTELMKFQRLLLIEGQALVAGGDLEIRSWTDFLAKHPISLDNLRHFDLSDSTNITESELIALTKDCKKLTKLILPGAFPSDGVMAILRENCPQAVIYPSAMTESEWMDPAAFMKKLPPPPQEVADFINGPRPIWEGITPEDAHMVIPKVNKIVRNIDVPSVMMPWTLDNLNKLDKATGGIGCKFIWDEVLKPANDKPSNSGFEWVVFTKHVLPTSLDKTFAQQEQLVEQWGYEMPGFMDATTCMLWEKRISDNRIYGDDPWTLTRCKDEVSHKRVAVGFFHMSGVTIYHDQGHDRTVHYLGAGGFRAFKI